MLIIDAKLISKKRIKTNNVDVWFYQGTTQEEVYFQTRLMFTKVCLPEIMGKSVYFLMISF